MTGKVTKWTESAFSTSTARTQVRPYLAPAVESFPIYVEENFIAHAVEDVPSDKLQSKPGLSIRAIVDGTHMAEKIYKNPLARHKEKVADDLVPVVLSVTCDDLTCVNPQPSKKSKPSMDSTQSLKACQEPRSEPTKSDSVPFSIFEDSAIKNQPTKTKEPGFTIFSDVGSAPKQDFSKANPSVIGFTIFSDETSSRSKTTEACDKKISSVHQSIRESPSLKTRQQEEDDEVMAVLGILDAEDTTINTKLAKVDIDAMFCSPGLSPSQRKSNKLQLQQTIGGLSDIKESSGDCDHSIFGTIATPVMRSSTKTFGKEFWATGNQRDDENDVQNHLQYIPEDSKMESIKFPDKR